MNISIFQDMQSRMDIIWEMYKDIEKLQDGMNILVVSSEILDDMKIEIDSNHTLWKIFLAIESINSTYNSSNFMVILSYKTFFSNLTRI
jgi:predicted acylesterase/phospholipase RssA